MMERRLHDQLARFDGMLRGARVSRQLSIVWILLAAAGVGVLAIKKFAGVQVSLLWWAICICAGISAVVILRRHSRRAADLNRVVGLLERRHPELRHLLSAAAEQQADPESGTFNFLQRRVIDEILQHRERWAWQRELQQSQSSARRRHALAFTAAIVVIVVGIRSTAEHSATQPWFAREIEVVPGDTQIERGTGLVITARFGHGVPAEATLVVTAAGGQSKRIPLERHLADPIFGATLPQVSEDTVYRVEYGGDKTRDFKIGVFDFPALVRADAFLEFPKYTGLTNKSVPDTLRISAVEGSKLTYSLQLNKPVARARLTGKAGSLPLTVESNALATLSQYLLTNSARYALELVDLDGRTNRMPADFSLQVVTNRRPDLKLAFPRGDQRVSKLEELQLQAEAADDFGLIDYGIGFGVAGQDPKFLELGPPAKANEKRQFGHLVALEQLGVDVDQVVAYFAWADDYGPDGEVRRSFSDMFFAEVRPFEEIFRRDQSGASESQNQQQQQQGQGQGQGNDSSQLAEKQKEIVIATWKLQQQKGGAPAARAP